MRSHRRDTFLLLKLICSLWLLWEAFSPAPYVQASNTSAESGSSKFKVNITLITEDTRPDSQRVAITEVINVSSERKMIFPPQHHWTVDKKSCVTIFSPKGPALTGQYYVLEPGEKVLEKISIGGLSVPVSLRGGYHAFSLPGIHRIQDTVTIEECSPFVMQRESRVKSNVVTCLVTYPADVEKVYRKLFRQLPPVWEITNINTGKGSLAGCFDITSLNRSIVSGRRTGLKPHMANCRVYFVPLSMDIDLPSHLNGNNPQFLDYKDLGRTSEYRLYGIMDNAGPEVLENFAEHIRKALN